MEVEYSEFRKVDGRFVKVFTLVVCVPYRQGSGLEVEEVSLSLFWKVTHGSPSGSCSNWDLLVIPRRFKLAMSVGDWRMRTCMAGDNRNIWARENFPALNTNR